MALLVCLLMALLVWQEELDKINNTVTTMACPNCRTPAPNIARYSGSSLSSSLSACIIISSLFSSSLLLFFYCACCHCLHLHSLIVCLFVCMCALLCLYVCTYVCAHCLALRTAYANRPCQWRRPGTICEGCNMVFGHLPNGRELVTRMCTHYLRDQVAQTTLGDAHYALCCVSLSNAVCPSVHSLSCAITQYALCCMALLSVWWQVCHGR